MSDAAKKKKGSGMEKLARFIVQKRNLIFLIVIIGLVFSAFSASWVNVENSLPAYLPTKSDSKLGLDLMKEQFTTFGSARVMVANVTYDAADQLCTRIKNIKGVQQVAFDSTKSHYNNVSALFDVTFDYGDKDPACLDALARVKELLSPYDLYVSTELGNAQAEAIDKEVGVIMVLVAVVIVIVLLLTSETFAEIPVLVLTFVIAMLLNLGTNFFFGTISFVSKSVTSILQLALSLDYAIILCNRFKEEHQTLSIEEAAIVALSKAIPEIGASCLTTIGGLVAMLFMQFRLGPDLGICLIKSIVFALLSVFLVMPGLLVLFGPLIDKSHHKNIVPKISAVGKAAYHTRHVVPFIFLGLVVAAFLISKQCPYVFGYSHLPTPVKNETQIAADMINDNFGAQNRLALMVPSGSYDKEAAILTKLNDMPQVERTQGLSTVQIMDDYKLTDKLTPRQFSELADLDYEVAQLIYTAYAVQNDNLGRLIGGVATYEIPLIDVFPFVCKLASSGAVNLSEEQTKTLDSAYKLITNAKLQLQGKDFSRMLIYLTLPVSGQETYDFVDTVRDLAQRFYPGEQIYLVGESTTEYDFQKSFARDNVVITILSILIVLGVLLFTFKSVAMPLLLILVIQGSIWINFSIPYFTGQGVFFMSYLIVTSIQMGANIDYAIVIGSRYQELKGKMPKKEAIIETLNFAFPTIATSGTILAVSGILIGSMTSHAAIVGIGEAIGRGTLISIFLVLFILPQILLLGSKLVDVSSFAMPKTSKKQTSTGPVYIDGLVRGEVNGTIAGKIDAYIDGEVDLTVVTGTVEEGLNDET